MTVERLKAYREGLRQAVLAADLYNLAGQDGEATKIQDHLYTLLQRATKRLRAAKKKRKAG